MLELITEMFKSLFWYPILFLKYRTLFSSIHIQRYRVTRKKRDKRVQKKHKGFIYDTIFRGTLKQIVYILITFQSFFNVRPNLSYIFITIQVFQEHLLVVISEAHLEPSRTFPIGIYMFKVNNRNTRIRCEICSKLTIKTPETTPLTPLASLWCLYC